jgi:hypothetical protein
VASAAGCFIEPDSELEALADPNEKLRIPIFSGYRAIDHAAHLKGKNPIYDELYVKLSALSIPYEDQCSAQYYFDLVKALHGMNGQYNRVVEVGVFMGGASAIFAGLIGRFDFDLDLVDLSAVYLQFTYSRIRRLYPEAASRVRLFHGNLPSYVKHVLTEESPTGYIVHHDGAHDFTQVTKDLASLSFVREKLVAVIAQDTHLRGTKHMNFVDMALFAVFGTDLKYAPIGACYQVGDGVTHPNKFQGNYFRPGAPEGMVVPLSANRFQYPHPEMDLEQFL